MSGPWRRLSSAPLNGISVALGVALIQALVSALFGLDAGLAYVLGLLLLPWNAHPYWLVLSVAVVLRGTLEQTCRAVRRRPWWARKSACWLRWLCEDECIDVCKDVPP